MERIWTSQAEPEDEGTVEQFLRRKAGLTRQQIRRLKFRPEGICKNGIRCRVTEPVKAGDVLRILLEEAGTASEQIVDGTGEICVLYEDEDLLVVDKPAQMVTHPTGGHFQDTLMNQVAAYLRRKGEFGCLRVIGRLDRETSGIVVFARNQVTAAKLQRQRERGVMQKQYLAVVEGKLPVDPAFLEHQIHLPIGQNPENRLQMLAGDGNNQKDAVTHFQVQASGMEESLVRLWLDTGRTHQIRVHMAAWGHPLVGDGLYGRKTERIDRAALHAWRMQLQHPFSGEVLQLEAPLPEDMKRICSC